MIDRIKRFFHHKKRIVMLCVGLLAGVVAVGNDLSELVKFVEKYNPWSEENSAAPIRIGMDLTEVEGILGKPQEINFISRSYFSYGIEVNPDYEHREKVGGVTAKRLPSGVMYKGKIDGIRLGESANEVKEIKGEPTYWGIDASDSSTAIWYKKSDVLTIVHFSANENNVWVADSITLTRASSFVAYRAILLSVFQELKAGRVSQFAEELVEMSKKASFKDNKIGMISLKEFSKKYLYQSYEFVFMKPAIGGGAEIYLGFGDKLLNFWVYPVGWEKPSLRAIVEMHKFYEDFGT